MNVLVYKTPEQVAQATAMIFAAEIYKNPACILGLATGSTPIPTYKELVRMYNEGLLDFSRVTSYNLDEYIGLTEDDPMSYRYFMNENLFNHVNIDKANTFVPSGTSADPEKDAAAYDAAIEKAGGIDLQLLGIGNNGHIAFNEPGDRFIYPTNVVKLAESTIQANSRFFKSIDDVPKTAICMGCGSIMAARRVILLATGAGKADAVAKSVNGPVDPQVPASILQMHPNCQFIVDEAAASKL